MLNNTLSQSKNATLPHVCQTQELNIAIKLLSIFNNK